MSTRGSQGDVRERIVNDYSGYKVYDERGEKLGKVEYTVLDERGEPEYLSVKTGFFGTKTTLLPESIVRLNSDTGDFEVEASERQVKDAPTFDDEEDITPDFEGRTLEHYGLRNRRETNISEDSGEERRESSTTTGERYDRDSGRTSDRENLQRRDDCDDFGASGSDERLADTRRDGSDEEIRDRSDRQDHGRDRESRDRESRDREDRDREGRGSGLEQVRVTLKREKVRAERVMGEDGEEEVRIRKRVVEEEQLVDVEDRREA